MFLKQLEVQSFRNLKPQRLDFPARVTLFIGANGQGKTSLLEAIYVLAQGKSFRTSRSRELVSWRAPGSAAVNEPSSELSATASVEAECRVLGELSTDSGPRQLCYELSDGKKRISINGNRVQEASEFFGQLRAIEFTPDDLQLIKGAPLERRQFIDRVIAMVDRGFIDSLVQYQRALKNRNALLLDYIKTNKTRRPNEELRKQIYPWDMALIAHGYFVARRRQLFVEVLSPLFERYYAELLEREVESTGESSAKETVRLEYQSRFLRGRDLMSEEELKGLYEHHLVQDLGQQKTNFGVHSDELAIHFNSGRGLRPARGLASQGQTRSLALALKFAAVEYLERETGEAPILLLDDVESELDRFRREALFSLMERLNCQVIVTATEASPSFLERVPEASTFTLAEGRVFQA